MIDGEKSDRVLRTRRSLINYAELEPLGRRPKVVQSTPTKRKQPADEDFELESDAPSDDEEKWSPASSKSGRTPPKSPRKSLNRGRSTDRTPTKRTPKNSPSKSPSKSPKINSPKRTSFRTMTGDLQYDLAVPKPRAVARTLNFDAEITLQDENLDPELHEDEEEDEPPKPKNSRMHEARARLWRDEAVKNQLLHRTARNPEDHQIVADFVNGGSETRCLFLAGVPGVGKTSCVLQAVSQFRAQKRARPFKFINLNGGQMIKPDELYIHFYTELVGHVGKISISANCEKKMASHERQFGARHPAVDELDFLVTKTQSVIYDVYDWAANPHSNVAVIGISNTLDLPTRVLLPKIQSRMGTNTIHFQPYDYAQLIDIVRARFAECGDVIRSDAIEFAPDQHRPAADVFMAMRMAQEGARLGFYNLGDAPGTFNRKIVLAFFGYEAKFYLEYKADEADKRKPAEVPKKPEVSRSQPAAPEIPAAVEAERLEGRQPENK
ncbi:hypothetical protein M3Y99_00662200 [Aphelenchoides fujianensis]|nr:hypothetical protein M3Y99_00662200 [Aphelenchoides fujianensis]